MSAVLGRIPSALQKRGAVSITDSRMLGRHRDQCPAIAVRIDEVLRRRARQGQYHRPFQGWAGCAQGHRRLRLRGYGRQPDHHCTPHRGSQTLNKLFALPKPVGNTAAFAEQLDPLVGDKKPDFLRLCREMNRAAHAGINRLNPDAEGVFYQSFACVMRHPFPI
jgi:hypothetical protein